MTGEHGEVDIFVNQGVAMSDNVTQNVSGNVSEKVLSADEVATMRERAEAATPGPWEIEYDDDADYEGTWSARWPWRIKDVCNFPEEEEGHSEEDAAFIATARTDVPALAASHEALRALAERQLRAFEILSEQYRASAQYSLEHAQQREQMRALATELAEALDRLTDDDPCRLDHHGYCQEHSLTAPCHTAIARDVLARASEAGVIQ